MLKRIFNRILKFFEIGHITSEGNVVYVTFDDGPEPGITEFVLDELDKYGMKATFFCKGENAVKNPDLFRQLIERGHAIGNHTYSHINSFENSSKDYERDVMKADNVLHTQLFRPPWGCLTFSAYLRLRKHFKIIYWSQESGDTQLTNFNLDKNFSRLISWTKAGDIILFHFCKRHEHETRELLPLYLKWLSDNHYISKSI